MKSFKLLILFLFIWIFPFAAQSQSGKMPTAPEVIERYISALGGREKFNSINDMAMVMETNVNGQLWEIMNMLKTPNKQVTVVKVDGVETEKSIFDGERLAKVQEGRQLPATVAETREAFYDAYILPEMHYQKLMVKTELLGKETVGDEECYKVNVSFPNGKEQVDYFSVATGLKLRSVKSEITAQGTSDMVWDYKEYKSVEGILFPYVQFIPPAPGVPQRLTGYVTRIELNIGLKDKDFKVK